MLKKIRASVDIELEIIPNQGCLLQCEFSIQHINMVSHVSIFTPEERKILGDFDYAIKRCRKIRQTDPIEFLMSSFIRPEDLYLYEGLGYNIFKIAGRNRSTEWMSNCLSTYLKRSYEGNVFDLSCQIGEDKVISFLPNKSLDGWCQYMGSFKDLEGFKKRAKEFYKMKKLQYFWKDIKEIK
jgi:collagenase-like PrtC family protease